MSYDYIITVADDASVDTSGWTITQPGASSGGIFNRFLDDIAATDPMADAGWLSMDPSVFVEGVVLNTRWPAIEFTRSWVLAAAARHGFAVLDPQTSVRFDPRGNVAVSVNTGAGYQLPMLSSGTLHSLLEHPEPAAPWLIVERSDHVYIQTIKEADGLFTVEYRDGGPDAHFAHDNADEKLVHDLIWSWCTGESWRTSVPWRRVTL
jgi:hypothetical protein